MNNNFEELVDNILIAMTCATPQPKPGSQPIPITHFNNAEPITTDFAKLESNRNRHILGNVRLRDLDAPLDISAVVNMPGNDGKTLVDKFCLTRIRQISAKMLRGQGKFHHHPIEITNVFVDAVAGTYFGDALYYGYREKEVDGKLMIGLQRLNHSITSGSDGGLFKLDALTTLTEQKEASRITLFAGIQFGRRYEWTVSLGYDRGLTIAFVTDPLGAKDVFRLRDIPEGKQRRAALKNWVTEHWRKNRTGESSHKVREHLRGTQDFVWNGLKCHIEPSKYDQERNGG